jgi:hypothetical protein
MRRFAWLAVCAVVFAFVVPAAADESFLRFDGGIGVIPGPNGVANANIVRNVPPGGQPWVIARLTATVKKDGRVSVDGRGLLLAGGNGIGTNGGQSVRAVLFCGPAASAEPFSSGLVPLAPNGDFEIDGVLSGTLPSTCANPALLIVSGGGRWFAAGIPRLDGGE